MLQRDYVLRLIEEFAKRVGSVLAKKKAGDFDAAERAIADASQQLIGLPVETLLALPPEQLLSLFRSGGSLDIGKCLVAADILREHADVAELRHDENRTLRARWLALGLYLEVYGDGEPGRIPKRDRYESRVELLLGYFSEHEFPAEVDAKLIHFREAQGRYADCEDLLFALIDHGECDLVATGIALYRRLLALHDSELIKGGLPREEVKEGLATLEARNIQTS